MCILLGFSWPLKTGLIAAFIGFYTKIGEARMGTVAFLAVSLSVSSACCPIATGGGVTITRIRNPVLHCQYKGPIKLREKGNSISQKRNLGCGTPPLSEKKLPFLELE